MSSEGDFCAEEEEEDGGWDRDDAVEGSSAISESCVSGERENFLFFSFLTKN